jgi:hypothetical protein
MRGLSGRLRVVMIGGLMGEMRIELGRGEGKVEEEREEGWEDSAEERKGNARGRREEREEDEGREARAEGVMASFFFSPYRCKGGEIPPVLFFLRSCVCIKAKAFCFSFPGFLLVRVVFTLVSFGVVYILYELQ